MNCLCRSLFTLCGRPLAFVVERAAVADRTARFAKHWRRTPSWARVSGDDHATYKARQWGRLSGILKKIRKCPCLWKLYEYWHMESSLMYSLFYFWEKLIPVVYADCNRFCTHSDVSVSITLFLFNLQLRWPRCKTLVPVWKQRNVCFPVRFSIALA